MRYPCLVMILSWTLGVLEGGTAVRGDEPEPVDASADGAGDPARKTGATFPVDMAGVTVSLAEVEETSDHGVHRHDVVIDLGTTPARRVRVEVELIGARRATRFARQVAAGAMSIAATYASPTAARAMTPLVATMSSHMTAPGETVFVVKGKRLDSLGGGVHVLHFRCVHLEPLEPKARITVRALDRKGALIWRLRTPWQPLSPAPSPDE